MNLNTESHMKDSFRKKNVDWLLLVLIPLVVAIISTACGTTTQTPSPPQLPLPSPTPSQDVAVEQISHLGEYSGYSEAIYSEWVRTSEYVPVRDGTKLAVDVIRPAVDGKPVAEPLPIVLTYERYHRARFDEDGHVVSQLTGRGFPFVETLLDHGYIIAAADIRGGGASYGTRDMEFMDSDATDAYDVIEWLAAQPYSDGNIGMYGLSYPGMTQFMAASQAPKALKAIIPEMTFFDLYAMSYPGGIFNQLVWQTWTQGANEMLDKQMPPVPVDADTDGSLAAAAQQEHRLSNDVFAALEQAPYRNDELTPGRDHNAYSLFRFVDGINQSQIPVDIIGGWFDVFPRDEAAWFNNLTAPHRLVFTPFSHADGYDQEGWYQTVMPLVQDDFNIETLNAFHNAEHLRFFDYYLKGIDNGIMDEPPVWYYTMGAPAGEGWRSAEQWPLPNEIRTNFYLTGGASGSVHSVNDGVLTPDAPVGSTGQDDYTVDYSTTVGTNTRWSAAVGGMAYYGDMTANDERSLTYTTGALTESMEITGHPLVHLWVSSTADDGDFFVYLSEVDESGYAHYITEGALRASHRALSDAPYNYMGLPYHRSYKEDIQPLPAGEPVELVFDLLPTSNIFDVGHRIRVTIMGADADTFATPQLDPAPTVSIYCNAQHSSYIDLPVIPAE
jgi:putative CocE/NonD family hydrolase